MCFYFSSSYRSICSNTESRIAHVWTLSGNHKIVVVHTEFTFRLVLKLLIALICINWCTGQTFFGSESGNFKFCVTVIKKSNFSVSSWSKRLQHHLKYWGSLISWINLETQSPHKCKKVDSNLSFTESLNFEYIVWTILSYSVVQNCVMKRQREMCVK